MRRALLLLIAVDGALGAIAACSGFRGESNSLADAGSDAQTSDVAIAPESSVDSGDAGACVGFDGSVGVTSGTVVCSGVARSLDTDPENCGACGHSCIGASCVQSLCVPTNLVGGISSVVTVGVDPARIYYFAGDPGVLYSSRKDQETSLEASTIVAEISAAEPIAQTFYGIAMDDASVYASTYSQLEVATIANAPTTFTPFATLTPSSPQILVTDDVRIANTDTNSFTVRFKDGGIVQSISGMPGAIDLAGTPDHRYFFFVASTNLDAGAAFDLDGAPLTRGTLYRWAVADQSLTVMTSFNTPNNEYNGARSKIAADDFNVYFSDGIDGSIYALGVDTSGTTAPTIVSQAHGRYIGEIVLDDTSVYFTAAYDDTNSAYSITRVSKCGGPEYSYVLGPPGPTGGNYRPAGLLTDKQFLYWGALDGVYRVAK